MRKSKKRPWDKKYRTVITGRCVPNTADNPQQLKLWSSFSCKILSYPWTLQKPFKVMKQNISGCLEDVKRNNACMLMIASLIELSTGNRSSADKPARGSPLRVLERSWSKQIYIAPFISAIQELRELLEHATCLISCVYFPLLHLTHAV